MPSKRSVLALAACASLAVLPLAASAEPPIDIETWPDDVPCDKLRHNPDGSYTITVPYTRYFTTHVSSTWRNTRETRYWDNKCKGKTQ